MPRLPLDLLNGESSKGRHNDATSGNIVLGSLTRPSWANQRHQPVTWEETWVRDWHLLLSMQVYLSSQLQAPYLGSAGVTWLKGIRQKPFPVDLMGRIEGLDPLDLRTDARVMQATILFIYLKYFYPSLSLKGPS